MPEIDLAELTRNGEVRSLSGHERGVAAREHFGLEAADRGAAPVVVQIPDDVYTLTTSFFQGMFAASVHALNDDRERFLSKYRFVASPIVLRQIERGISSVRTRRDGVLSH